VPPPRRSDHRRRSDPRRLSDKERAEWLSFTQALGAKPLRPSEPVAGPAPLAVTVAVTPVSSGPVSAPIVSAPGPSPRSPGKLPAKAGLVELTVGGPAAGLDSASWERLRRGRIRPQRVLDLHGRTVQAAFGAFQDFIRAARADGIRCVEIVTGRGAGEGGALRRELPLWLNLPQMRGAILAATHPHRANVGAVVLLLRRVR
jgi:DNA-nicking Smr family endonuclease